MGNIFDDVDIEDKIFKNKTSLNRPYIPDKLLFRDSEILKIARGMAPILNKQQASDFLLYGTSGSGKTATLRYITRDLQAKTPESTIVHIDNRFNTEYRIVAKIHNDIVKGFKDLIPATGLPIDNVYEKLGSELEQKSGPLIISLEDVNRIPKVDARLIKKFRNLIDESKKKDVLIVGTSDTMNPTISETFPASAWEWVKFNPYTDEQLEEILNYRAKIAFNDDVVPKRTISYTVEMANRYKNNVGYGLDLLKRAGEIAIARKNPVIIKEFVKEAADISATKILEESIQTLNTQEQIVLRSVIDSLNQGRTQTGWIYERYEELTEERRVDTLTQRRITDILDELSNYGIIKISIVSRGRHGRTKEITLDHDPQYVTMLLDK